MDTFLGIDQVADLLGVQPEKIERVIDRGMLPGHGLRGADDKAGWRIGRDDLADYLLMLCQELGSEAEHDRIIERIAEDLDPADPFRSVLGPTEEVRSPDPPFSRS